MEFTITEHISPCSYIRQYPHGAKNDDAVLQLAVKEYRPKNDYAPDEDAVTIIAAHGIGFPKVLLPRSAQRGHAYECPGGLSAIMGRTG